LQMLRTFTFYLGKYSRGIRMRLFADFTALQE
jgi:hypothetical protein